MKNKKLKLSLVLLLVLGLTGVYAQEVIPASGGNTSGSGGSVSYSIGQVVYTTNSETNGSVAQGVQQPFEISVVTGLEESEGINLAISAYPNPTTQFVKLIVEGYKVENLSYHLYDMHGKLLESKKIVGNETNIIINNLIPAIYFVKVTDGKKQVKSFKIIKY